MQQLGPPTVLQSILAVQSISKLFFFRSSTIIFRTVFVLISSSYANIWSKRWWFYSNSWQNFLMLPSLQDSEGQQLLGSCWTSSHPSWNHPYWRKMLECCFISTGCRHHFKFLLQVWNKTLLPLVRYLTAWHMVLLHNNKQECTLELLCSCWH